MYEKKTALMQQTSFWAREVLQLKEKNYNWNWKIKIIALLWLKLPELRRCMIWEKNVFSIATDLIMSKSVKLFRASLRMRQIIGNWWVSFQRLLQKFPPIPPTDLHFLWELYFQVQTLQKVPRCEYLRTSSLTWYYW